MSESKMDDMKGRAKEAIGSLTDNEKLKKDGKADQRSADVKKGIERIGDKAKDAVDEVKRRTT